MIKELTSSKFDVIKHDNNVHIIIFTASWCDSCKMAKGPLEELSDIYDIYKADIEKEPNIVSACHITSIPTTIVIKNNRIITKESGYRSKVYYATILNNSDIN